MIGIILGVVAAGAIANAIHDEVIENRRKNSVEVARKWLCTCDQCKEGTE